MLICTLLSSGFRETQVYIVLGMCLCYVGLLFVSSSLGLLSPACVSVCLFRLGVVGNEGGGEGGGRGGKRVCI